MRKCQLLSLVAGGMFAFAGVSEAVLITADGVTDNGVSALPAGQPSNASDGDTATPWYTTDPGGYPSDYFDLGEDPVLSFTFSSDVEINGLAYWSYAPWGPPHLNSPKSATIAFMNDGGVVETVTVELANLGGSVQQDLDFQDDLGTVADSLTVDEVKITITDNYYDAVNAGVDGGDRVGFVELQFNTVPEPASIVLIGLGGLAMIKRRK